MTEHGPSRISLIVVFVAVAAGVTVLDLWSKRAVFELLAVESAGTPPRVLFQKRFVVIPDWFELEANYNYGAFSGWFSEHTEWLAVLSATALIVILGIFIHQLRQPAGPGRLFTLALAFLWGGTCGNLYDRAALNAVRDWIKWFYVSADGIPHIWPNFNVADSSICTGVGLLILLEVLRALRERRRPLGRTEEENAGLHEDEVHRTGA